MSFFFDYYKGRYKSVLYTIIDTSGNPVDLTDVELVKWAGSTSENSETVLLEKSWPGSGIQLVEPASGIISIVLSGVELERGTYYHQSMYRLHGQDVHLDDGTFWVRPTII